MKITETDIGICWILGEFADKELKFGCIIKSASGKILMFDHWRENKVTIRKGFIWKNCLVEPKWEYTWVYTKEDWWEYIYTFTKGSKTEVIWQYWLHSILRWVESKILKDHTDYFLEGWIVEVRENWFLVLSIDTTLPPMERPEEKKKELLAFLIEVNQWK